MFNNIAMGTKDGAKANVEFVLRSDIKLELLLAHLTKNIF